MEIGDAGETEGERARDATAGMGVARGPLVSEVE
jgi:hypothetical protein